MAAKDASAWLAGETTNVTKVELQKYLRSRDLPTSGNKTQLTERVRAASKMGYEESSVSRREDGERDVLKLTTPLGERLPDPVTLTGWIADNSVFPEFTEKELYNYLVLSRKTFDHNTLSAKKELTKAHVFYEDGHVTGVQYHGVSDQSTHAFVKSSCLPSFPGACPKKKPAYNTWICLSKVTSHVHSAHCDCVAGQGESCNHIAALLFALVDNTKQRGEGKLAPTAQACSWIVPRKRTLSPKRAQDIIFRKTSSSTTPAQSRQSQITPEGKLQSFRDKIAINCPKAGWLKNFSGSDACEQVSLLDTADQVDLPQLHHVDMCYLDSVNLKSPMCVDMFSSYFQSLSATKEECTKIYDATRGQSTNEAWMTARNGRLTASCFGMIIRRKPTTAPDNLLKILLQYKVPYQGKATQHGLRYELIARDNYLLQMKEQHPPLEVVDSGLCVNPSYPHLGASPDGLCSCSHCENEGLVEIKCPFTFRHLHPTEAAKLKHANFCCHINAKGEICLKRKHLYYYQIQGQMGITDRKWCDFVIWTFKGMTVERIYFDKYLWLSMLEKLDSFFLTAVIPELLSGRVKRGKALY